MDTPPNPDSSNRTATKTIMLKCLKKVGFWGFLFFLAKGLIWLALGYWVFK